MFMPVVCPDTPVSTVAFAKLSFGGWENAASGAAVAHRNNNTAAIKMPVFIRIPLFAFMNLLSFRGFCC